jgi:tRNA (adenine57-N1/adenine58-N1)-methyltransferase catalytic subunit
MELGSLKNVIFLVLSMAKKEVFSKHSDTLVVDDSQDLHTKDGIVTVEQLKKSGKAKSTKNVDFFVTNASFVGFLSKIKRGPAIMVAKDIGAIIAHTGVSSGWNVVDAGTGCGVLSSYLSRIVGSKGKITSYERKEEFLKIAKKNFELLGVDVEVKNKDVYEGIDETELDLITLDLPEPWRVLEFANKSLKNGSFLVSYLPTITQVDKLVNSADDTQFFVEKVLENLEREWHVDGLKVRPKNRMLGHTGFLVFLRKL